MKKGIVVNSWDVKPFVCDDTYSSKMLLDDIVAGEKAIHINEGTLKGGCSTGGSTHFANEIYYVVKGEAVLFLGDKTQDIQPGSVAFIPAGTFHSLKNKSDTEDFVLLTLWENPAFNDVYEARMKAWGTSFKTIGEV